MIIVVSVLSSLYFWSSFSFIIFFFLPQNFSLFFNPYVCLFLLKQKNYLSFHHGCIFHFDHFLDPIFCFKQLEAGKPNLEDFSGLCRRSKEDCARNTKFVEKQLSDLEEETSKLADRVTAALVIFEEHKRDHREKLKIMSNKAWAKNQSNDTTRKNLPNHCREVDAPLQCVGVEIDSLKRSDGGVVVFNDLKPREAWCQRCGSNRCGKIVWPYLDQWDSVRLRTTSTHWNVPKKYGHHGEGQLLLCKMRKTDRVVDVPVVMHCLFPTIQIKRKEA